MTPPTPREFPRVVWEFVAATNSHDSRWLLSLFAGRCGVAACGLSVAGPEAIASWLEVEIVGPRLSLIVDDVRRHGELTTLLVRACDHGLEQDCTFQFGTRGRYIESLVIAPALHGELDRVEHPLG